MISNSMVTPPETFAQGAAHGAPSPSELATQVAQQLVNLIAQEQRWRDPQEISYTDFAALQPPIFTTAIDPLDADDCLRIIESKFSLLPCLTEQQKARFAAQCLHGLSGAWCASFLAMQPAGHQVTWDEFRASFRAHYLPPSLIELKQREFRVLRQRNMSAFIRLSQYSPVDVDTDPCRAARLLGGFDPTLLTHLGRRYDSFTELVDVAIDMEHRLREAHEDQQRKRLASTPPSSPSQRQQVEHQFPLQIFYLEEPQQQEQHSGAQQHVLSYHVPSPPPVSVSTAKPNTSYTCFKCGKTGHFRRTCHSHRKTSGSVPTGKGKRSAPKMGQRHYSQLEQVSEGEPVLAGTFLVNDHPTVVLFDSGVTFTFISKAYAQKHEYEITELKQKYRITAVGSSINTNHIVRDLRLQVGKESLFISPLVLPQLGIDIILGMEWLKPHNAMIDVGSRTVQLRSSSGTDVIIHVPLQEHVHHTVNAAEAHVEAQALKKIPVACEYPDVFPEELPRLPPDRDVEFRIDLVPGMAPASKWPYRMAPDELKELKTQLQEQLDIGFIQPSSSPWRCPFFVEKKDQGGKRLCMDYRPLNAVTVKNKSGYHQIKVREEDIPKTALSTRYGLYEYLVMSFRLTNAPAFFMYLMNSNEKEHEERLRIVLSRLKEHKLYAKFSKYAFLAKGSGIPRPYLGVAVDPSKVEDMLKWKQPQTVIEIRSFLGLAGYYRRFIKDFSKIAKPMIALTQKNAKFAWSSKCEEAFGTLNKLLTSAPVLAQPDITKPFDVYCDASCSGLSCVLMQEGRVIAYTSSQLRKHEVNYPTHDLELLAVVYALKKWRHYLLGNTCHIYTDHKSLKYIFTQPELNMRQRRWLELIKYYDLEVHYHPGKASVVADALSRKAHCNFIEARPTVRVLCCEIGEIEMPTVLEAKLYNLVLEPTIKDQIIAAQKQDKGMAHIRDEINDKKKTCFKLDEEGVVWFKNRLVVPKDMELRKKILDEAHTSMFTLHPGSNKMYQDLKQKFWWTHMKREIAKYVSECDVCQRVKADHLKPAVPTWKWDDIHMDFIVGLPRTPKGYDSIWVIIDRFTKSAHFIPVKTIYHAKTYAEVYIARIVFLHGVPQTITSDRGLLSAYHPQTSGQVERVNQILEDMLRECALTYSTKWDECLSLAEFAYNNRYQKSLGMVPFEALYGRRCRTPLNWSKLGERVTFSPDLVKLAEEQSRQKSYSDKRRRPLVFEKDDHVYLRVVHRFGVKGKLAPRYVGPFKITEQCGPVAYRLELPPHLAAVHDVFHVSQMKKCLRVPEEAVDTSQIQIELDLTYEEKPIKVLDQRQRSTRRRTIKLYKVQWSNHSEEEATWEQEKF
ncbi:hypothetical protein U9M48_024603, partial [Paspalum notatum var. saurae]